MISSYLPYLSYLPQSITVGKVGRTRRRRSGETINHADGIGIGVINGQIGTPFVRPSMILSFHRRVCGAFALGIGRAPPSL